MKKSILSLSAAVALGGLGYVGAASAAVVLQVPGITAPTAVNVFSNPGGVGHALITPYYTAQGVMSTAFNIANTDLKNGKAVKVRFRGASNSDDVMDFTVFLSPGDVWTAAVSRDVATGLAQISTEDKSCTYPTQTSGLWPADFNTDRLSIQLSDAQRAALTREGYVEVLNMADIPPTIAGTKDGYGNPLVNPLFAATKHVAGVAPCTAGPIGALMNSSLVTTPDGALAYGLDSPTGGLMGSWGVFNTEQLAVYGGAQSALLATAEPTLGNNGTASTAPALINFAPQTNVPVDGLFPGGMGQVAGYTSDVILLAGSVGFPPLINPGNLGPRPVLMDFPDLSTPMVTGDDPFDQASRIGIAFEKERLLNDYVAAAADASTVSWMTDWVVTQPVRRYHAAVAYDVINPGLNILNLLVDGAFLINADEFTGGVKGDPFKPYTQQLRLQHTAYGPMACMDAALSTLDREERTRNNQEFSPGTIRQYCGESFTLQFGNSSVLQAGITAHSVADLVAGPAGWAQLVLGTPNPNAGQPGRFPTAIPAIGFAATSIKAGNGNYGLTLPHRWTGPARFYAMPSPL